MLCEILFKVGDSGVGNTFDIRKHYLDGMPVAIKPTGTSITPAEWLAWLNSDAARPTQLDLLEGNRQLSHARLMQRTREVLDGTATVQTILAERFPGYVYGNPAHDAEAQQVINSILDVHAKILVQGLDTNWGFSELTDFGVMISDVEYEKMSEILTPPVEPSLGTWAVSDTWAQRGFVVPYDQILSGDSLADIQTKGKQVAVARGELPISYGEVLVKLNRNDY